MRQGLKALLDAKYAQYATPAFVQTDPIRVPRAYSRPEDMEIAAFLTAILAWGQRGQIIAHAQALMGMMGHSPYQYVTTFNPRCPGSAGEFRYRTFNGADCVALLNALRVVYCHRGGLKTLLTEGYRRTGSIRMAIHHCRTQLIGEQFPARSRKHLPDAMAGSAAKRINLFLRWMVRPGLEGIDLNLWPQIPPAALMLPLDVHSARVARGLGLLTRTQNDWEAVEEVTQNLRAFDPHDPVKYDYALFGLGLFENM